MLREHALQPTFCGVCLTEVKGKGRRALEGTSLRKALGTVNGPVMPVQPEKGRSQAARWREHGGPSSTAGLALQVTGIPGFRPALQITSWPDKELGIHVVGEPFNTYQEKAGETSVLGFRKMSLA